MEKNNQKTENFLHQIFEFGILIKAFNGIWELIVGFIILFFGFDFKFLQHFAHNTQTFIAVYLLIHSILNIFLAIQLYRDKIWAYLATITITTIFIIYQVHRVIIHHSIFLTAITIFDILFIILAWHEYKRKKYKVIV